MKRAFFLIAIPLATVVLAACGGGGTTESGPPVGGPAGGISSAPAMAEHNSQDVMFAQMMIPHHRQAVQMARQAATKASSPEVKRIAAQIESAQQPEIDKMTGWLKDWGAPTQPPHGTHMAEGMMSEQDMEKLATRSGTSFDRMFLQMMIKHHQGAVAMAKTEQEQGANPDAKALAGSIVASQSAEITRMRTLLKDGGTE
jgi:uncharacterized protein (DUF305 family)